MISGYLCLLCNVSCSPPHGTYDRAYRLINRYNNNNYLMELDQIMRRRRLWARKLKSTSWFFLLCVLQCMTSLLIIPRQMRRDIVWYMFCRPSVRPSIHPFFCPSVRIHKLVTTGLNFMKLVLNMHFLNDVTHVKFGQAVFSSTWVIALELIKIRFTGYN